MPVESAIIGSLSGFNDQRQDTLNNILNFMGVKEQRKYNESIYEKQKQDNLDFWRLQNDYNSPANQMARYKAAGLSPHLIYGKAGDNSAGNLLTPNFQSTNKIEARTTPNLSTFVDNEIKVAQADNLRAQNQVLQNEALLKAAQTANTLQQTDRGKFDLEFETELRQTSADARREALRQLKQSIDIGLKDYEIRAAQSATSIKEALERIVKMRIDNAKTKEEIQNLKQTRQNIINSNKLQELDIQLKKMGLQPHDPLWQRTLIQQYDLINSAKNFDNKLSDMFTNISSWFIKDKKRNNSLRR